MILGLAIASPASATEIVPGPTAAATATIAPEDPDLLIGEFTQTPDSGPAGSTVTVTSIDTCVDAEGDVGSQVQLILIDDDEDLTEPPVLTKIVETDADGAWSTTFAVPAAAPDSFYLVIAACYADSAEITDETLPFLIYAAQPFLVTSADEAPVASPIVKIPTFNG